MANPLNTDPLHLDREAKEIRMTLRLANPRDDFAIEPRLAVIIFTVISTPQTKKEEIIIGSRLKICC